jgi:hypothetical protein
LSPLVDVGQKRRINRSGTVIAQKKVVVFILSKMMMMTMISYNVGAKKEKGCIYNRLDDDDDDDDNNNDNDRWITLMRGDID